MWYQSLLCRQQPEASHGFFDNICLLQVWLISCDAFPVLLQPELEARLRPETRSRYHSWDDIFHQDQFTAPYVSIALPSIFRRVIFYLLFSASSVFEVGGGAAVCWSAAGSVLSLLPAVFVAVICSSVDWVWRQSHILSLFLSSSWWANWGEPHLCFGPGDQWFQDWTFGWFCRRSAERTELPVWRHVVQDVCHPRLTWWGWRFPWALDLINNNLASIKLAIQTWFLRT